VVGRGGYNELIAAGEHIMTMADPGKLCDEKEMDARIRARYAAEEVASLADEEAETHGKFFWKCLHDIICAHVPCSRDKPRNPYRPMTVRDAHDFGRQQMPFGEYVGKAVDHVPLDYLQWLADQTFVDDLRRYLESERLKVELGDDT